MNKERLWYETLIRPFWAPPAWVFKPVWMILYPLIALSLFLLIHKILTKKVPAHLLIPFALNLFFNILFPFLQFELQNNLLACADIILVWVTLAWGMIMAWAYLPIITYLNVPYFVWVSFATLLEITITYLNR